MSLLRQPCTRESLPPRRRCAGFTYIGLLVLIAIIGIMLAKVGEVSATARKHEKEAELLWVGDQYRRAIARYRTGGGFPQQLEDLLQDPRSPDVRRYLRQLYRDPITGSTDWGLLKVDNNIIGVYSKSEDEPLKKANFPDVDRLFEGKEKYSEWVFAVPVRATWFNGLRQQPVQPPVQPPPGQPRQAPGQQPGQQFQQPVQQPAQQPGQTMWTPGTVPSYGTSSR